MNVQLDRSYCCKWTNRINCVGPQPSERVRVEIMSLSLRPESRVARDSSVVRLFVEYSLLDLPTEETPLSLPKPPQGKSINYNYSKGKNLLYGVIPGGGSIEETLYYSMCSVHKHIPGISPGTRVRKARTRKPGCVSLIMWEGPNKTIKRDDATIWFTWWVDQTELTIFFHPNVLPLHLFLSCLQKCPSQMFTQTC